MTAERCSKTAVDLLATEWALDLAVTKGNPSGDGQVLLHVKRDFGSLGVSVAVAWACVLIVLTTVSLRVHGSSIEIWNSRIAALSLDTFLAQT